MVTLKDLIQRAKEAPYAQHGQLRVDVEDDARGLIVSCALTGRPATMDEAEAYLAGMDQ